MRWDVNANGSECHSSVAVVRVIELLLNRSLVNLIETDKKIHSAWANALQARREALWIMEGWSESDIIHNYHFKLSDGRKGGPHFIIQNGYLC
jgi:hypothetical protein